MTMTEESLKQGQALQREIGMLEDALDALGRVNQAGVCIVLPKDDKIISKVRQDLTAFLKEYKDKFSKL